MSSNDPLWYKNAVYYEVFVRAFADSNGDGIGDLRGLTSKLDYMKELGVDCVWLLPIYPSPLRDDGYDVADFYRIHPDYGTVEDFRTLVEAAHQRGLRVIADLVPNHTSDQIHWFQPRAIRPTRSTPSTGTGTCGVRPTGHTPGRASSFSTMNPQTGPGIRCGASTTGTASSITSRI